mgnify:CR=1 FL=1
MKKFSKILMSGLAALCLWACSDEANVSQPANAENDVYVEFGVQLMQGSSSRSTTTDGEDGNGSNSTGVLKWARIMRIVSRRYCWC